jgi:hypothetical protein
MVACLLASNRVESVVRKDIRWSLGVQNKTWTSGKTTKFQVDGGSTTFAYRTRALRASCDFFAAVVGGVTTRTSDVGSLDRERNADDTLFHYPLLPHVKT